VLLLLLVSACAFFVLVVMAPPRPPPNVKDELTATAVVRDDIEEEVEAFVDDTSVE